MKLLTPLIGDVTKLELENRSYDVVISFSAIERVLGRENGEKAIGLVFLNKGAIWL